MSVSSSVQKKLYRDFRALKSLGDWLEDCGGIFYFGQNPDISPSKRALSESRKIVEFIGFDLDKPLNLDRECDISYYEQDGGLRVNGWDLFFSDKFLYEIQLHHSKLMIALLLSNKKIQKLPRAQLLAGLNHITYELIPQNPHIGAVEADCKVLRKYELFEGEYQIYYVVDEKIKAIHFLMVT